LFLSGAEIFRRDVQDAVGIDVEGHFDLRNAARRRRDTIEMEDTKLFVVARERSLALQHFNFHARLIVAVCGKDLRLARRDRGIARNHLRSYATRGFDRERQRCHIE
jgi:hypothetical protein